MHPCDYTHKRVCQHHCNKVDDTYECSCTKDYQLNEDKHTCKESKFFDLSLIMKSFVVYIIFWIDDRKCTEKIERVIDTIRPVESVENDATDEEVS